jgi:hypothetical protein
LRQNREHEENDSLSIGETTAAVAIALRRPTSLGQSSHPIA